MIGILVFIAAAVWALWVMIACVIAMFLFFVQIVLEGLLALSRNAEDAPKPTQKPD